MQIKSNYIIHENTLALIPAKQPTYDTIVMETHQKLKVRKTPLQLIKAACYHNWSTYEGRRQAVIHHTNFRKKIPIPINTTKAIYFFPTQSPTNYENHWLSYRHIEKIKKCATNPNKTIIVKYHINPDTQFQIDSEINMD
jgi:competence protein ComK